MKKRGFNWRRYLVIILAVIVLASFVLSYFNNDIKFSPYLSSSGQTSTSSTSSFSSSKLSTFYCNDSDNGQNYEVKGTTTYGAINCNQFNNNKSLCEYSGGHNGLCVWGHCGGKTSICDGLSFYGCRNMYPGCWWVTYGSNTCSNINALSVNTDKCDNESTLIEYSCSGVRLNALNYNCENGCGEGVCVSSILRPIYYIDKCQEINKSGIYILNKDILDTDGDYSACLEIKNVNDVVLNCRDNSIINDGNKLLEIQNVSNFTVESCIIGQGYTYEYVTIPFTISDSKNGIIINNKFLGLTNEIYISYNIKIINNVFNSSYQHYHSSFIEISNNLFYPISNRDTAGNIVFNYGRNNKATNNIIDGKSDGNVFNKVGIDDGIVILNESYDLIENNTISNHWDCGIENNMRMWHTVIKDNYINNQGVCGIGGWYWNSWLNNTLSGNIVNASPTLFHIYRVYNQEIGESIVYFKDNKFFNNTLINAKPGSGYSSIINMIRPNINFELGNNLFDGNDFGKELYEPHILPPNIIVDKMNNICKEMSGDPDGPLICI